MHFASMKHYTTCYVSRVMFAICCNVQMFMCIVIVVNEIHHHCFIPSRRNKKVSKIQQHCFIPSWREIKKRMKFNTIVSSQIGVKLKREPNSVALQLVIITQDLEDLRFTAFDLMKSTYIIVHSHLVSGTLMLSPLAPC